MENIDDILTAAFAPAPQPSAVLIPPGVRDWQGYLIARAFRDRFEASKVMMHNSSKEAVQMSEYFDGLGTT